MVSGHCNRDHLDQIRGRWSFCEPCNYFFPTSTSLSTHKAQKHNQSAPLTNKPDTKISCRYCSQASRDLCDYQRHLMNRHKDKLEQEWLKCPECGRFYETSFKLNKHRSIHCTKRANIKRSSSPNRHVAENLYCEFCSQKCTSSLVYLEHCNRKHLETIRDIWPSCPECSMLVSPDQMDIHKRRHQAVKKYVQCQFCPRKFQSSNIFYSHVNSAHGLEADALWLKCPTCEMMLPDESELAEHIVRRHETAGKLDCNFCNLKFVSAKVLKNHKLKRHSQELQKANLKCDKCDEFMEDAEGGEDHLCKRYFRCDFCLKTKFVSKAGYCKHANRKHLDKIRTIWMTCKRCFGYFPDEQSTKSHNCSNYSADVKCEFCGIQIASDLYVKHCNQNHINKISQAWTSCSFCSQLSPNYYSAIIHIRKCHFFGKQGSQKLYRCQFCQKGIPKIAWIRHSNTEHKDSVSKTWTANFCKLCLLYFPSPSCLVIHCTKKHPIAESVFPDSKYKCRICSMIFPAKSDLKAHFIHQHREEVSQNWFQCDVCKTYYETEFGLKIHLRQHIGNKLSTFSHECKICTKKVKTIREWLLHCNSKHQSEISQLWHFCKFCDYYFHSYQYFQRHTASVHTVNAINCAFCESNFFEKKTWIEHSNAQHKSQIQDQWKFCDGCGILTPFDLDQNSHNQLFHQTSDGVANRMNRCQFCPKKFRDTTFIEGHYNSCHQTEVSTIWFKCNICEKYCKNNQTLAKHRQIVHNILKTNCSYCPFKGHSYSNTIHHMNSKHRKEICRIWIKCKICQNFEPNPERLTIHQKTAHKGVHPDSVPERPVECTFCLRSVKTVKELICHAAIHHPEDIAQFWLKCDICQLHLPSQDQLIRHIERKHNTQVFFFNPTSQLYEINLSKSQRKVPEDKIDNNTATADAVNQGKIRQNLFLVAADTSTKGS